MKAVIFAAGLGTRLRPLTETVPKPMLEVGGLPILARTLAALPSTITETIVVVGHLKEKILAAGLERRSARPIRFVTQTELLGTYDALLRARPFLDGPFLALNGDDLYAAPDLERLCAASPFALLAHRVDTPNPYSHLETEDGTLKRIVLNTDSETLPWRRVYVGACLLDQRFFALAPGETPSGELGLPQTLERHVNTVPVQVLESSFWLPVGTPDELERARQVMRS